MKNLINLISRSKFLNLLDSKKGYLYYILGEALSKGIIFLLLAFYTNYLDKENFGKLSLFWVAVPLLSVFIDLSQRSYVKSYYVRDGLNIIKLIRSIKLFSVFVTTVVFLVFLIKDYFNIYIIERKSDYYLLFCALFFSIIEQHLSYFQIKGDFKLYNVFFVIRNTVPYVLASFIIYFFSEGIYAFMLIQLITLLILSIFLSKKSDFFNFRIKESINLLRSSINFSLPFIPGMLSVLALSFSDRFIINYYYSEIEVAEYTVAYTVSSIFAAFFLATNKMWQKFILENLKMNNFEKIRKSSKRYIFLILIVGIGIVLLRNFMVSLMSNDSYLLILDIVPTIIAGMFFYFLYTVLSNIPFFYKNTFLMALPAIIAALLNLILNFVLIPEFGYKVAATTTAISYTVEFLVIYLICVRKYKIDILFNGFR